MHMVLKASDRGRTPGRRRSRLIHGVLTESRSTKVEEGKAKLVPFESVVLT